MELSDPSLIGLCLDVGHYTLAGGDAADGIRRHAPRLKHLHMKDVDADVLARVRSDATFGFVEALRQRIFTELGSGVLDLTGVIHELMSMRYAGWIMCEQDSSWWPASESASVSRRVLDFALRQTRAENANPTTSG